MKVIIVGGVAGGASCAARLRRLDETAEILMVERGPYVSYANCGLPYHVGGVIPEEAKLLVANAATFRTTFGIDARTSCEAIGISPDKKTVDLKDLETGEVTTESYDKLVLSPGALRSVRRFRGSICPGSSSCGPCPTPDTSASGSRRVAASSPASTPIPDTRRSARRPARWWSEAASSAWRRRRTWCTAGSR